MKHRIHPLQAVIQIVRTQHVTLDPINFFIVCKNPVRGHLRPLEDPQGMALLQKAIADSGSDEPTTTKDSAFHPQSIPEDRHGINSTSIDKRFPERLELKVSSFFWLGLICAGSTSAAFVTIL
jgi:hypothetical protein